MWMGLLLGVFYFVSILLNDDFFLLLFSFQGNESVRKEVLSNMWEQYSAEGIS